MSTRSERIAALNDELRRSFRGGRVLVTAGVRALPLEANAAILQAVQAFAAFTPENDPYGEHDFGDLEVDGKKIFFKIDYYNLSMTVGSEDPVDPAKTARVLTVMLAEEY